MKETENNGRDAQKREFAPQLLDSYFMFRDSLPHEGYIQKNKTTLQVMDDLIPMTMLSTDDVVQYMLEHDCHTTNKQDGIVVWAIWRQV